MVNELEQKLKEGVISQKEYDYLMQNRISGLPSYCKSMQFILLLGLVPFLQAIVFQLSLKLFLAHSTSSPFLRNFCAQIVWVCVFFLIYKFSKKRSFKMIGWVSLIFTLGAMLTNIVFLTRFF